MTTTPANRAARIRQYLEGAVDVVEPRDAASVVLLRDGAAGMEAYLLRRRTTMAFGAGMHVFPGGSVDPRDGDADVGWIGPSPEWWARAFSCAPQLAAALVCAAIRETFEESGVLLASGSEGGPVPDTTREDWEADRLALVGGSLPFSELLARRSLLLRADLLRPWAHWITPEWASKRFDTRFFIAAMPSGRQTRDVGGEADWVAWMPISRALEAYRAGTLTMMLATANNLRDLAVHPDVASAMAASRRIRPIKLRPVVRDGDVELVYDGVDGVVPSSELVAPLPGECRATGWG